MAETPVPVPLRPIAITMGCPAGVGPEIIIKAFRERPEWLGSHGVLVFGDRAILKRAMDVLDVDIPIVGPGADEYGIHLREITALDPDACPFGKVTGVTGRASYEYIVEATTAALKGQVSAVVTAPITKDGLRKAGIDYPGHTEILANLTGTRDYLMMLMGSRLKVVLVTIHIALKDVPASITRDKVLKAIKITAKGLRDDFGIERPRIGVAGLNPHAGESGLFGMEEKEVISPAVKAARAAGIHCTGPHPPDTIFYRALNGEFDVVCAQYHDQGLIPLKLIHFEDGVNVTMNLPIVRTSVDHGTAYDIAGTGAASPLSLIKAVETAQQIARCRQRQLQS